MTKFTCAQLERQHGSWGEERGTGEAHVIRLARDLDVRVVRLEERGVAVPARAVRARVIASVVVATKCKFRISDIGGERKRRKSEN